MILRVKGTYGKFHYVVAIGYKDVKDIDSISESNIIILDPANKSITSKAGSNETYTCLSTQKFAAAGDKNLYGGFWTKSGGTSVSNNSKTCTITFDPNGGSVYPTTKTVVEGTVLSGIPEPTRDGYTFIGWSTAKVGSGMIVTDNVLQVDQNTTLYALWRFNACNHTYKDDLCTKCGVKLPNDNGFNSGDKGSYRAVTNTAYVYTGPYMNKQHVYTIPQDDAVSVVGPL